VAEPTTVLQQDPPATIKDQGATAVRATVATTELALLALPSTTVPMGTARVRRVECRLARTPLRGCTHAPATLGTLEMGKRAPLSTTVLEREEERTPAPAMLTALQPALETTVVPATRITLEME